MSSQFYIIVAVMAAAIGVVFLLKYLAYREALQQARCQEDFVEKCQGEDSSVFQIIL